MIQLLFEGAYDRCATGHLDGHESRSASAHQPERLELVERFLHPDDAGPTTGRIDDPIGQGPAELLDDLETHRLLALGPIRLLEGRKLPEIALEAA